MIISVNSTRRQHTRVVLADDDVLLREGLARMLVESGFEVTAQVGDAAGLLAAVDADPPDVCIVDIRMPPTNTTEGLQAALQLRTRHPGVAVLVLSQYVETRYAIELLARGADGGRGGGGGPAACYGRSRAARMVRRLRKTLITSREEPSHISRAASPGRGCRGGRRPP